MPYADPLACCDSQFMLKEALCIKADEKSQAFHCKNGTVMKMVHFHSGVVDADIF